eukprot:7955830-Prorocentrum_lima.AAC.1
MFWCCGAIWRQCMWVAFPWVGCMTLAFATMAWTPFRRNARMRVAASMFSAPSTKYCNAPP